MRTRPGTFALIATAVVVASGLAACAILPSPLAPGPLVTVETRGGLCAGGPCGTTVVLDTDGRVHAAAKPPNDLGTVDLATVAAIDALVRSTDFDELRSHPFTGLCPVAFDGQEVVFEFATPAGPERIASCEVEVDFHQPLFAAVGDALGPFISLPAP